MMTKYPKSDFPKERSVKPQYSLASQEERIAQLAKKIRRAYIVHFRTWEERITGKPSKYLPGPAWDGGITKKGQKRRNIWKSLAGFFLEHNLDPYNYLRVQFFLTSFARPRRPNQLMSAEALREFRQCAPQEEDVLIRRAFEAQKEQLLDALDDWQSDNQEGFTRIQIQLAILLDTHLSLSALFRFCLAISEKLDRVAERYLAPAILQYLSHPDAYDKVWGEDWIPKWFSSETRKCQERINKGASCD